MYSAFLVDKVNVLCLGAFFSSHYRKLNLLSLIQGSVAGSIDGTVVHKDILRSVTGDKSITLCCIEPLHGASFTLCHGPSLPFCSNAAVRPDVAYSKSVC